jgi:hypothetical protein
MATNPLAVPGVIVPSGAYVSPGGPQGFQGQPGPVGLTGAGTSYYGIDTTNNQAYAVSVAGNFSLTAGVVLFVTASNANLANPTLNVNGLGAKNIVTLANVALAANAISANVTFGVMWDNTSFRKFC